MIDVALPAADGTLLRASLFEPKASPRAAVVIASATAVPRAFYRAFAQHLASLGAAALTFDYRGAGEPPQSLKSSTARMRDWGALDFSGALSWMRERYAGLPLSVVGHSVGGHALLQTPENVHVNRAVTVASQSGYWRLYRGAERYRVYAFMAAIMPALTSICGYFPSRAVGFGEDLAPGILREWSRWCTLPGYFFDDPSMRDVLRHAETLTAPVLMIGLSDDPWATPRAIDALQRGFTHAQVSRIELVPHQHGLKSIGHMNFFRAANGERLWPYVTSFLELSAGAPTPGATRATSYAG